ncbi:uncharacterized protein BO88DRAFT_453508 [Aspergillus vadensis CBS 113365]|uniref:Uncharacterized protein n=1 Tax=Aspergillus vadensis (strain CBS 113365 / IMI 142717 / IBT 24658) TaxID=1448311 RepID=A0A319B8Z3_ASPVC|nr:hypothetical protein BO88DRAFT_453508 [Aspergillus vadensis CBS 113365]PYH69055.1 hypothetical protein BO88DRAFT_453508 [Aspergillus vadensis CBS 113365]
MQHQSIADLYFASCDLINPLQTRIKVYFAEVEVTFTKITENWTLSGMVTNQKTLEGLQMLRELWKDLCIVEGKRSLSDRPTQPGDPETLKLPSHRDPEMRIANALTAFFQRHRMQNQSAAYTNNLKSYYPGKDLDVATDHQAWLSFSYTKKKGPYLTIYYH